MASSCSRRQARRAEPRCPSGAPASPAAAPLITLMKPGNGRPGEAVGNIGAGNTRPGKGRPGGHLTGVQLATVDPKTMRCDEDERSTGLQPTAAFPHTHARTHSSTNRRGRTGGERRQHAPCEKVDTIPAFSASVKSATRAPARAAQDRFRSHQAEVLPGATAQGPAAFLDVAHSITTRSCRDPIALY